MAYLLDTNVCVRCLRGGDQGRVIEHLAAVGQEAVVLCSVVRAELMFGALRSERVAENLALVEEFMVQFPSLVFDDLAARQHARLRAALSRAGQGIGPNDSMIAAIAMAHDAVLVTHNTGEFARVSGLRLEDWEA
jgi:tRNA(fMet)-specific endonuclease VapC